MPFPVEQSLSPQAPPQESTVAGGRSDRVASNFDEFPGSAEDEKNVAQKLPASTIVVCTVVHKGRQASNPPTRRTRLERVEPVSPVRLPPMFRAGCGLRRKMSFVRYRTDYIRLRRLVSPNRPRSRINFCGIGPGVRSAPERQLQPQRKVAGKARGGAISRQDSSSRLPRSQNRPSNSSDHSSRPQPSPREQQQAPKSHGGGLQGKGAPREAGGEPNQGPDKEPKKAHN